MKTKIVYVLVSTQKDIYLEQAWLSIFSLRKKNDNVSVTLVIDDETEKSLDDRRKKIKELVDEIIVECRPKGATAKASASGIKTRLREIVKGDFLFIDTDTIICDDLSDIDNCQYDVAAVPDAHVCFTRHFGYHGYVKLFKKIGFEQSKENYYNSGVIYVKDTEVAHTLYKRWHESYSSVSNRCFFDQPHLAFADSTLNVISELDGVWNCQIQFGLKFIQKAKIIHYFASNFMGSEQSHPYFFMDKDIFQKIKESAVISYDIEKAILNAKSQWCSPIEVVGGKDVSLQHSYMMKILRWIYYRHSRTFSAIETIISRLK